MSLCKIADHLCSRWKQLIIFELCVLLTENSDASFESASEQEVGKDAVATLCVWVFVLYMHMPHFVCACVWRCKFNKVQSLLCATGTHSFKRLPQNETNLFSPLFSPSNCSIFSMYKVKTFSSQHPCAMSSTFRRCQSTLNVTECMYSIRSRPLKAEANGQASALQPLQ